jgi:flavorubredoxin
MKIGIIVYSKTGNTRSVAEKLREELSKAGNEVSLEEVTTAGEPGSEPKKIELKNVPGTEGYEAVVFAAPVWAFTLCSVMKQYFGRVQTLKGQKVGVFVTESFKKPWLGGSRAVRWMKRVCAAKDGAVSKTGVINWSNPMRDEQIDALVRDFASL